MHVCVAGLGRASALGPSFIGSSFTNSLVRSTTIQPGQVDWHLGGGEAGLGRGGAQDGVALDDREALEQERVAAILEETSRAFINTSLVRCRIPASRPCSQQATWANQPLLLTFASPAF